MLTKHYSSDGKTYGFRTTYSPLIFAIADTESQPTYTLLMQAAARAASALCNIDLPRATRQYHADMHPGQEAARRDVFPASARVSDFAHLIRAARSSSSSHRSGLFSLAKNNLSREGQRLMPLIEHTIHLLRVAPTALIFHTLASLLFDTLLSQQTFQSNDGIRALSGLGTDSRGSHNPVPVHMQLRQVFLCFWTAGSCHINPEPCEGIFLMSKFQWLSSPWNKILEGNVPRLLTLNPSINFRIRGSNAGRCQRVQGVLLVIAPVVSENSIPLPCSKMKSGGLGPPMKKIADKCFIFIHVRYFASPVMPGSEHV